MTTEEYRAAPGVNFSSFKHILRSPAYYRASLTADREETIDMLLGTLVHKYWLEGGVASYVIKPEGMNFATKEGKAWRAAQTLPILTQEESARERGMIEALEADDFAKAALARCPQRERPIFFSYRGVACKALIDACGIVDGRWTILDLKKTQDARPAAWGKNALNYDYCFQAAFYRAALASAEILDYEPDFFWQVVEDSICPTVVHYPLTDVGAHIGQRRMDAAIDLLLKCQESGEWPGYGHYLEPVWPAWALAE